MLWQSLKAEWHEAPVDARLVVAVVLVIVPLLMASPAWAEPETLTRTRNCAIQGRLKVTGYYAGNITCTIGEQTRSAIRAFQRDNGIAQTGTVGPKTYARLFGRERGDTRPVLVDRGECPQDLIACRK